MVRRAAMAGTWYPGSSAALAAAVDAHLDGAGVTLPFAPAAMIAPHAGLAYSGPVAAAAYAAVRGARYRAVVLVGPSHAEAFPGVAVWPAGVWETPLGPMTVDERLAQALVAGGALVHAHAAAHVREHSLELQMPFLARLLPEVPIVPLLMGRQTRRTADDLGRLLALVVRATADPARRDIGVLLVASSDLSHYEDARAAAALDGVVVGCVEALDPEGLMSALEREPRHACGGGPMVSVLLASRLLGASQARVLRYADSGDVTGDKSSVVGYMAAAIW